MSKQLFITMTAFLLTSCGLLEVVREQKRAPAQAEGELSAAKPIATTTSAGDPPVEKKFKNIQVLQGLPSSQLYPVMAQFANSLGVTCAHCHTEHFEEESRTEKQVARQMIRMTRDINHSQFNGEPSVTCFTCHRGQEYPSPTPLIAQAGWQRMITPRPPEEALPELEAVLAKYSAAVRAGAAESPRDSGEISLVGGLDERASAPFELTRAAGGSVEIKTSLRVPPPLTIALARYGSARLLQGRYDTMAVLRRATIEGKEAVIVSAAHGDDPADRLAFDSASGLLMRVESGTPTAFGFVPEEMSFSDYQMVAGVPTPRTIRWARGDFMVTLRFAQEE